MQHLEGQGQVELQGTFDQWGRVGQQAGQEDDRLAALGGDAAGGDQFAGWHPDQPSGLEIFLHGMVEEAHPVKRVALEDAAPDQALKQQVSHTLAACGSGGRQARRNVLHRRAPLTKRGHHGRRQRAERLLGQRRIALVRQWLGQEAGQLRTDLAVHRPLVAPAQQQPNKLPVERPTPGGHPASLLVDREDHAQQQWPGADFTQVLPQLPVEYQPLGIAKGAGQVLVDQVCGERL